jgi:hypothetical protein
MAKLLGRRSCFQGSPSVRVNSAFLAGPDRQGKTHQFDRFPIERAGCPCCRTQLFQRAGEARLVPLKFLESLRESAFRSFAGHGSYSTPSRLEKHKGALTKAHLRTIGRYADRTAIG